MKKTILAVLALMFCWGAGFAQFPNVKQVTLTPKAIQNKLIKNEILPLNIFSLGDKKQARILRQNAQQSVGKHANYVAYYNAAVVYFTIEEFQGSDVDYDMTGNEKANVVKYATKAIGIAPKTPDMYLLRGLARFRYYKLSDVNGIMKPQNLRWIKVHKKEVREMLADFEKVEQLNWKMAPYSEMALLYEGLGQTDKATHCQNRALKARQVVQAEARQEKSLLEELECFFGNICFGRKR